MPKTVTMFGFTEYKGKQKEIFEAAINGEDVLVVAPTGMGKSICFQVPAIVQEYGITIVISPLLEVARLRKYRVHVASWTSETPKAERNQIIDDLSTPCPINRLLYITPEKLCSPEFIKLLVPLHLRGELNRLVVDEAHCISEWGHDFREEYRRLGQIRQKFPDVPLMALTASATALVQEDIARILGMNSDRLLKFVHPFNRPNLFYEVRYHSSVDGMVQMNEVLNYIKGLHSRRGRPSTGIIYCRTRVTCDDLSNYLRGKGLNCRPYHKGVMPAILDQTLKEWEEGGNGKEGVDIVCATIAFGMGIDKSDVRYIIHYDLPKSFEGAFSTTSRDNRRSREDMLRVRRLVSMSHTRRQATAERNNEPPPSQRSTDSFSALVNFSENTDICRHISICRYFGETIDTQDTEVAQSYCENMCDVCKNPDKTRKRKEALSPAEAINSHAGYLQMVSPEDEDVYPVPQVRAARVPLEQQNSGSIHEKPDSKQARKPNVEEDAGALPCVNSTSTVLAPIGAKSDYVGPALLRSRHIGLKRSGSSEIPRNGSESFKKSKSEHSAPSGHGKRTAQFRVPFKVPFNTVSMDHQATSSNSGWTGDKADPLRGSDGAAEVSIDITEHANEALPSSPSLSDNEIDLDASFSQKIPVFLHSVGCDDGWDKLQLESPDDESRSVVLSSASRELEFSVHSMSVSRAGYATRSLRVLNSIERLASKEACSLEQVDDWDVMEVLRRSCLRLKE
ncbi:ATP-dependent DNA helicase [Russula earlei]|uniref:ATP-dependent DNA helicase n=1 Tax=Russula earlei TaxID=71964 RepID=A0ACC0U3G0_9AGAM|nr:ATP-dependent DNA helicase [Russula earlei]